MSHSRIATLVLSVVVMTWAASSSATPRPLPFTYTTETLGQGELEIEMLSDLTRVTGFTSDLVPIQYVATQFQTEIEYGITDRLELGLYVVFVPTPASVATAPEMTETTGIKERLRYVFADPGAWPVDVGVYGELVEGDTEAELEAKVLLQRRFGNLRIAANLWAEYELNNYGFSRRDLVLNPTLGATYQVTPTFHVGVEGWFREEITHPATPNLYAAYVGPTALLSFGKIWWSVGVYGRAAVNIPPAAPGSIEPVPFGGVWGRSIIGLNL